MVNLLVNAQQALEAQPPPRHITITAWAGTDGVTLAVADNGPGVPAPIRSRIFDPFFTTKPVGFGTGIGLAVSRGMVEAHGGTLTLAQVDGGARFEVWLRHASEDASPAPDITVPDHAPVAHQHTALIIDDEPEVAAVLAQMVSRLGFRCAAESAAAACGLLEQRDYDAILCDLHMPGMDGAGLFAWLGAHKPHLRDRVVFITADTLGQAAGKFLAQSGRPVLEKPFVPDEVRRILAGLQSPRLNGCA